MRTRQKRIVSPGEPNGVQKIPLKYQSTRNTTVDFRMTKQKTRLRPVPTNLNKPGGFIFGQLLSLVNDQAACN